MQNQREQTIMDNEVYDVIRAVASKLEGLTAYNKYEQDGQAQLWQQMRQQDEQSVRQLMQQLDGYAQKGKLKV